ERAGGHRLRELGIYDGRFLPGLTRLADAIHQAGGKCSIQLGHGGGHTRFDICGETPVAPSAIPHPVFEVTNQTIVPRAMSVLDICNTVVAFAAAAARARKAGFTPKAGRSRCGRRRPAPTRCTSPPGTIVRCRRARA